MNQVFEISEWSAMCLESFEFGNIREILDLPGAKGIDIHLYDDTIGLRRQKNYENKSLGVSN